MTGWVTTPGFRVAALLLLCPAPAARAQASSDRLGVRVFGDFAHQSFKAQESFDAVLGGSSGRLLGGGAQVTWRRLFLEVAASRFRSSGERVLSSGGRIYRLGVPTEVTIAPLEATAGYRLRFRRFVPYAGVGAGSQHYKETSPFSDDAEKVSERHTSYHVLGGVELPVWRRVRAAVEARYRTVPDAIGLAGLSKDLGEQDLGGTSVRLKLIVVGR